jgi:hypothetical protein
MPDGGRAPLPHLGRLPHPTPVAAHDHDGLLDRRQAAFVYGVKVQRILRVVRVVTRVALVASLGRAVLDHLRGVTARTKDRQKDMMWLSFGSRPQQGREARQGHICNRTTQRNAGQQAPVPEQMQRWPRAGGKVLKGLEGRSEAAAALYAIQWS